MNNCGVYFMTHSIETQRGGMTRAVIQRASLLAEHGKEIGIITFDFNPDYEDVIEHYCTTGLWNRKIRHFNVYEFFERYSGEDDIPIEKGQSYRRQTLDYGKYQLHKEYKENRLHAIDCLSGKKKKEKRILFDRHGNVRQVIHFDPKTSEVTNELFFTRNGRLFFKRLFHPATGKSAGCFWFDRNGKQLKAFRAVRDYRDFFIHSIIQQDEAAVFVSDSRFSDRVLFHIKNPKVAKLAVLHSNHLQFPFDYGSSLVPRNGNLLQQLSRLDGLIVLTDSQANDIRSRFGDRTTIHVIGHPAITNEAKNRERDPYTAVMLARFQRIKQIPHAIKAFKKVIKQVPQAKLEIWGFGKDEARYKALIKKLHLEKHVFVMGFTHTPFKVYQRAAFSIITSKSEAFGMSIVESMAAGTPVICYACKYGPSDLIEHGKNGLLVETDHINGLAEAITDLFLNKEKREALGIEAQKISQAFCGEVIAEKWLAVFEEAIKQKDRRMRLGKIVCKVEQVAFTKAKEIYVQGRIFFNEKDITPLLKQHLSISLQLRRKKRLEDVCAPLEIRWLDHGIVAFQGVLPYVRMPKGIWDIFICASCLNDHMMIRPGIKVEADIPKIKKALGRTVLQFRGQQDGLCLKVYKTEQKEPVDLKRLPKLFYMRSIAKLRDMLQEIYIKNAP